VGVVEKPRGDPRWNCLQCRSWRGRSRGASAGARGGLSREDCRPVTAGRSRGEYISQGRIVASNSLDRAGTQTLGGLLGSASVGSLMGHELGESAADRYPQVPAGGSAFGRTFRRST
jgi:hypothetical protein